MKMYEKKNFPRTSYDFVRMYNEGKLSFDNAAQRSLVWDNDRNSLLIHSMIIDFAIPPLYCNCIFDDPKQKVYDFIDGKQRILSATIPFLNDEYVLTNVPIINTDENAENDEEADPEKLININGLKYSELPEEFQRKVSNHNYVVYYYENMLQKDVKEMYKRLNNGKSQTAIELTRVRAKSLDIIKEIAKHNIFTSILTKKAINRYTNEDIVIKSWMMLYSDNLDMESKNIRPTIEQADITEDQANNIKAIYDKVLEVYTVLTATGDKHDAKVAKRLVTRTHLISLVPIISKQISKDSWNTQQFTNWARHFFAGAKSATIDETYNDASRSGSGKSENVKKRLEAIESDYRQYIVSGQDEKDAQEVA